MSESTRRVLAVVRMSPQYRRNRSFGDDGHPAGGVGVPLVNLVLCNLTTTTIIFGGCCWRA